MGEPLCVEVPVTLFRVYLGMVTSFWSTFMLTISHVYADYSLPFVVNTDASLDGLGAILYQTHNGQQRHIAFASRGLTFAEKNYPAHKLEFLALKWALSEKFHDYMYGHSFKVQTDNYPRTLYIYYDNCKVRCHWPSVVG